MKGFKEKDDSYFANLQFVLIINVLYEENHEIFTSDMLIKCLLIDIQLMKPLKKKVLIYVSFELPATSLVICIHKNYLPTKVSL